MLVKTQSSGPAGRKATTQWMWTFLWMRAIIATSPPQQNQLWQSITKPIQLSSRLFEMPCETMMQRETPQSYRA
ncbi:hypothetical protein EDB80DRAFT_742945, partial [Ilyonectria destructans]